MLVECNRKGRKKRSQNARLIKRVFEEVEANLDEDACINSNYVIRHCETSSIESIQMDKRRIMDRKAYENGRCSFFVKNFKSAKI